MARRAQQKPVADSITREEVAAFITGLIALFIKGVLPVITFWWRFAAAALFVVFAMDLCLRSRRLRVHLPSPIGRLVLSLLVFTVIAASLWNPMRTQYVQEHLPPSLPFIFGAPLGDNDSPIWIMLVRHYGPDSAYNCDISFWDLDRKNIEHDWLVKHPEASFPPPGLAGGDSQKNLHIDEADPLGNAGNFRWIPLDRNYQHYTVATNCRDGEFEEHWNISRIDAFCAQKSTLSVLPRLNGIPNLRDCCLSVPIQSFPTRPLHQECQTSVIRLPLVAAGSRTTDLTFPS
jgi:hypothetical protein